MGHWLEEEKRQAPLPEAEVQGWHALSLSVLNIPE